MGSSPILDFARGVTHWGIVVLVLLGLVILTWVVLRRLAGRWQVASRRLSAELRTAILSLSRDQVRAQDEAARFPPDAPPPYADPAHRLRASLEHLEARRAALEHALDDLEARSPAPPDTPLRHVTFALWDEPRFWRQHLLQLESLAGTLPEAQAQMASAQTLLRDLRGQPLRLARRARALRQTVDDALANLDSLRVAGVHGDTFDTTASTLRAAIATLHSLPEYLLTATESQIIRRADLATTAASWDTLTALQPRVESHAVTVRSWVATLPDLQRDLETMREAVAAATTYLSNAHPSLDLAAERTAWQATERLSEKLDRTCASPTIEDLAHAAQVREINQEAHALMGKLASLEALRLALETSLAASEENLEQADLHMRQLSQATRYPLDRVPLQAGSDRLRRQAAKIRSAGSGRTPAQLEHDLAAAQVLDQRAQRFLADLAEARENRRRLIELLDHQLPGHGDAPSQVDWLAWAEDLHQHTVVYAPENWLPGSVAASDAAPATGDAPPRTDLRVPHILDDAQALAQRQQALVPARVDEPLQPQTLSKRVAELAVLIGDIEAFVDRLGQVTHQLQQLQRISTRATADMKLPYEALERLDEVAERVLPTPLAQENNHWRAVREHLDAGYALGLALSDPGSGAVRDHVARLGDWLKESHTTVRDWQHVLDQERRQTREALQDMLDDLASVARLDGEVAVRDARLALERDAGAMERAQEDAVRGTGVEVQSRIAQTIALLADEASERLQALAKLDTATAALQKDVLTPLAEPVSRWREAQEKAEDALGALQLLEVRSGRLWPPVSCDTKAVKAKMRQADTARDTLRQGGATVHEVIDATRSLAVSYEQVASMATERERTYEAQRTTLDEILARLDAWCNALEDYRKRHHDDPAVAAAVRARLDEIEASWNQLQVQYDHAPDLISGERALRDLDNLWRQAHRDLPLGGHADIIPADQITTRL